MHAAQVYHELLNFLTHALVIASAHENRHVYIFYSFCFMKGIHYVHGDQEFLCDKLCSTSQFIAMFLVYKH